MIEKTKAVAKYRKQTPIACLFVCLVVLFSNVCFNKSNFGIIMIPSPSHSSNYKKRQRPSKVVVESKMLLASFCLSILFPISHSFSMTTSNNVMSKLIRRSRLLSTHRHHQHRLHHQERHNKQTTHLYQSFYVEPNANDEDEDLIRSILGPKGNKTRRPQARTITILSDTTGVTAKCAVEKSLKQFNGCDERVASFDTEDDDDDEEACELLQKRMYPFIKDPKELDSILAEAKERESMVVFTFGDPKMRTKATQICQQNDLLYVDLLGGMFDNLSIFFGREPLGTVELENNVNTQDGSGRRRRELTDYYFDQMEAIEFTLEADDGKAPPSRLPEADVILLGVSRTGKTPLSVFLSQSFGLKVANIPLNLENPVPNELFSSKIDPNRVFCLTLDPDDLQRIREARLERETRLLKERDDEEENFHHKQEQQPTADYADWDRLEKEIKMAKDLVDEHGFTEIDVTGRAVEETASLISSLLNQRLSSFQ